jgi:pilus assembly protein Flp/PilA
MPSFARLSVGASPTRVIREIAMNARIRKFFKEEDGVTALEYGLLAAVVAGIILFFARDGLTAVFRTILTKLQGVVTNSDAPATT